LDSHGKILTSKAYNATRLLPQGSADLGSAFTLPAKPVAPGAKWSESMDKDGVQYKSNYTFASVENEGDKRVAIFEKQSSDTKGTNTLKPTIIKIDIKTGVLIDKVAEIVLDNPQSAGHRVTVHFETKLK
jgi:hypothetical protein